MAYIRLIENSAAGIDLRSFSDCIAKSDFRMEIPENGNFSEAHYERVAARNQYVAGQIPRLHRIFNAMLRSSVKFNGPTLDVASGWGILYPALKQYINDALPYCIAEMKNANVDLTAISYDGDLIQGVEFECDKDILSCEDKSNGTVLFLDCLEHLIVDPLWTLLEFNRVLRPNGHLVISTPNAAAAFRVISMLKGNSPLTEAEYKPSSIYQRHNREWTLGEVTRALECVGFGNFLFTTQEALLGAEELRLLDEFRRLGYLQRPIHEFGPELLVIAEKIEHVTLGSDLQKDRRWPAWLYTSFDAYRRRPDKFPIVVSDDFA